MKCVICSKEADYVFSGDTICQQHYDEKVQTMGSRKEDYYNLVRNFKGTPSILHTLFSKVEDATQCRLGLVSRIAYLNEIGRFIDKHNVAKDVIDTAMWSTVKSRSLNHRITIAVMNEKLKHSDVKDSYDSVAEALMERKRNANK